MKSGVSGKPIPVGLPFADEITKACSVFDFPPCLAYAIKQNETDGSTDPAELQGGSFGGFMPDGSSAGKGIFQETSSWPTDWSDPYANALYALEVFLIPAWNFWTLNTSVEGDDLIKCVAASFNSGLQAAWENHCNGSVDSGTTDNYGQRCVDAFHMLTDT